MNENSRTEINSLVKEQFKDFLEACEWSRQNMGKKIIEWPPGWKVNENMKEDTPFVNTDA